MRKGVADSWGFVVGVGMRQDLSHDLPKFAIDAPIISLQRRPRRTRMWIVGLGVVALAAFVLALPALIGASYLAAGQAALADRAMATERQSAGSLAAAFQQPLSRSPSSPEAYRPLAQSYLRLGHPQDAVNALEQAHRLQPDGLLIPQELTYETAGYVQWAIALLAARVAAPKQIIELGDVYLLQRRYGRASRSSGNRSSYKLPLLLTEARPAVRQVLPLPGAIGAVDPA